ncbi:MAG: type I DNA topoisomerase [Alphaproteobacteria bacterium]
MNLVVVESPAKAKTINKYLGPGYRVLASFGHIRDLPSKDGSVLPDQDFEMLWEVGSDSKKHIKDIADGLKGSDRLILATDPDREGEAISWHILKVLEERKALKGIAVDRVTFNAITEKSIKEAMANPRKIDQELVDAYLARRALDYLVGFTLSPVLWRKLPGARSAGRVQSVALRLVCDRELEIEAFKAQEYWTVEAELQTKAGENFTARLIELHGKKLDKFDLKTDVDAENAANAIKAAPVIVTEVETRPARRNPQPPFMTSTLAQEAARKLGFTAKRTMQIAQRLYEGVDVGSEGTVGLITYMRTDGVDISPEALTQTRDVIKKSFGDRYLPDSPRLYKTKAKNAQEAHEAIRPTSLERSPDDVKRSLDPDQFRLYELIWKRTVASQMESAQLERTTATLAPQNNSFGLRATGTVVVFDGFLRLYQEGRDEAADGEDAARLPKLTAGDEPKTLSVTPAQHFTEPPPRYSEATLIKKLEELGIGRPSTYAQILSTLQDRGYVRKDQSRFIPEDKGRLVTAFLESFFKRYVEYDFTADLEEKLDLVSNGEISWKDLLKDFWRDFTAAIAETTDLRVSDVLDAINDLLGPHIFPPKADGSDPRLCPTCGNGRLSLKTGKFGAFIGCSNYPECKYTRQLGVPAGEAQATTGTQMLGKDPVTGLDVTLRSGRFGPYVQLGEAVEGEKPKRAGIPKDKPVAEVDLDYALALLALPRLVGEHPETHKPIEASIGQYGPYLRHDGKYARLDSSEEVFSLGLNRAVTLIAERAGKGNRRTPEPIKVLGNHPDDGKPVNVMKGRYGPYVSWNKVYATIPKSTEPEQVTMEQAVELLAERVAKGGGKKARGKAKAKSSENGAAAKAPKKAKATKANSDATPSAKKPAAKKKAAPKKKASSESGA